MSFDKIIDVYDRQPVSPRYRAQPEPLLATAYRLVDTANENLPTQRQIPSYAIREIFYREGASASTMRSVTQFISTTENPRTATPTKHTDLLHPGHPLSTADVPNRRAHVANYFACDSLITEDERPLVASAISAQPDSVERKFILAQLHKSPYLDGIKSVISKADSILSDK